MSATTYNTLTTVILLSALLALGLAIAYLVAAVVGWRGPHRKARLLRCAVCAVLFPTLVATQYAMLFFIFLPSLGRQRTAEMTARRQVRADAAAYVQRGDQAPA